MFGRSESYYKYVAYCTIAVCNKCINNYCAQVRDADGLEMPVRNTSELGGGVGVSPVEILIPRSPALPPANATAARLPHAVVEPLTGQTYEQKLVMHAFSFKSNQNALQLELVPTATDACLQFLVLVRYRYRF